MSDFDQIFEFIRSLYPEKKEIHLHAPVIGDREKQYVNDCLETTMVSNVGAYVGQFEAELSKYIGTKYAVTTFTGTAALQLAMRVLGIGAGDEVLTQALTFVATANAIGNSGAQPVFLDVHRETLGMNPDSLKHFLKNETKYETGKGLLNRRSGRRIKACLPVHIFGHPCHIEEIASICRDHDLFLVEDAAESLGSERNGRKAGSFGHLSALSFNGNKIITTGGGGALLTDDPKLYQLAKALATTAKVPHPWDFYHNEMAYNYRLPNINAALGCAQMEQLDAFLADKRETAARYKEFFSGRGETFFTEPASCRSNFWLNAIFLKDAVERDQFLTEAYEQKIFCRPAWHLMCELPMYKGSQTDDLSESKNVRQRLVNIPSSVRGAK